MCIGGNLLAWISCFIGGKTQRVTPENCFSYLVDVVSGVPQESFLGPKLFLTVINDVVSTRCGNTTFKLFADDLKLYSIYDMSNTYGPLNLQRSIDQLVHWPNMWQLEININKCHVLSTRNKTSTNTTCEYLFIYISS
jgi:Reverse transcriptase (RNA-dependent DNA polymerase)